MGKIASPGIPYCDGEPTASLSVNGDIVTTQNPPISYTLSGTIATVSDALGVIGTFDLSGALIEVSRQTASPNTPYCGDNVKSVLRWNTGLVESNDPPIQYVIGNPDTVKIVWEDGTVEYLEGSTWSIAAVDIQLFGTNQQTICSQELGVQCVPPGTELIALHRYAPSALPHCSAFLNPNEGQPFVIPTGIKGDIIRGSTVGSFQSGDTIIVSVYHRANIAFGNMTVSRGGITLFSGLFGGWKIYREGYRVTTNTGAFSERTSSTPPVVSFSDKWDVSVSDATGEIASRSYTVEPINFQAICYDYDISEVSYACIGCPSGTLFECTCPATNTKYCYGFDPDNPDVFKPLFESPIA